jgi:hypothetical protein
MTEQILQVILKEFDLIIGGIIIALIEWPIFKTLKKIIVDEWQDIVGLILAIVLGIVYGIIRNSAFATLEAIAGSQLIFILIKKGLIPAFNFNKKNE